MGENATGWHITTLHMSEKDDRRHKSRCIYYDKMNNYCRYRSSKCIGSAHCHQYKELSQKTYISHPQGNHAITKSDSKWKVGVKVNHPRYGLGVIVEVDDQYISASFTKVPQMLHRGRKRKKTMKYIVRFEINAVNDGAITIVKQ